MWCTGLILCVFVHLHRIVEVVRCNRFHQAMIDENFLSAALILAKEQLEVGDFVNLTGSPGACWGCVTMPAPVGSGRQSACGFYTSFKLVSLAQESQFGRILRDNYIDPWQADFRMENHSCLNELPVSKTAALTEHAGSAAGANPLRSPGKKKRCFWVSGCHVCKLMSVQKQILTDKILHGDCVARPAVPLYCSPLCPLSPKYPVSIPVATGTIWNYSASLQSMKCPSGDEPTQPPFCFSPFLLGLLGGRALFNNTISACSMTIAGRIEPKQAQVFLPTSLGRYHATGRRKLRCLQELLRLLRSCRGEFATSLKEFSAGRAICFFLAHWFAFTRTLIDITYDDITYTYCFNCLHAFYLCSLCWHSLEFCWADCHVR